jgi:hypothetical protein
MRSVTCTISHPARVHVGDRGGGRGLLKHDRVALFYESLLEKFSELRSARICNVHGYSVVQHECVEEIVAYLCLLACGSLSCRRQRFDGIKKQQTRRSDTGR